MKKLVTVGQVQKGDTIIIDGAPCRVVSLQVSRTGKHGHAKVRLEGVGLIDEKKRIIVMPGHDKVDSPIIDKKTAQVLSVSDKTANVMDMETYETFDLEIPEELKGQVVAGAKVIYWKIMEHKLLKQIKGG